MEFVRIRLLDAIETGHIENVFGEIKDASAVTIRVARTGKHFTGLVTGDDQ